MSRVLLVLILLGLTGCATLRSRWDGEAMPSWDCGDPAAASATAAASGFGLPGPGESPGDPGGNSGSSGAAASSGASTSGPTSP